uniref:transposase n=1 Tax=Enterococcus casseliflavus TaxID=37734 RepID=UPI00398A7182
MQDEADKEVARLMNEIDSPILTIPGIGFKLRSVILAEVRDIKNFRSPNQLLALCRCRTFCFHFWSEAD